MPDVLDVRSCTTPWPPTPQHTSASGPISVRQVLDAVSLATGVSVVDIVSVRRGQEYWIARNLAAYLCRQHLTHLSTPAIGRKMGDRDHTTVLHNARRWQQRRQRADMRRLENAVRQRLGVD
jgi:chromosomal replication initiation ATPase DnaA